VASDRILVVNSGSSSVKLRVVEADDTISAAEDLGPPDAKLADALAGFVARMGPPDATAHRVVHGGGSFSAPTVIDDAARAALEKTTLLAPLHNPPALVAIDVSRRLLAGKPCVACFDTSFHTTISPQASTYAIPASWRTDWGVHRYGFHGLSCAWATRRAPEILSPASLPCPPTPGRGLRLVICHLGSGSSVSAVEGGRSVDTTMGFSPLEGLVMASRPGDLDSAVVLLALRRGLTVEDVEDALENRSGLLGLSDGRSADMRDLLEARRRGDGPAGLAVSVFVHRLRAKIAAMAAATSGTDAVVFTGGIGENSAEIRAEVCAGLEWMGVHVDPAANEAAAGSDRDITGRGSSVAVGVVAAREELQMVAEARRVLRSN
jgi:acetate kinase